MNRLLYIFRHGQTDWNVEGRIQGNIDIPLNNTGRDQARRLAIALQRLKPQAILSSDLVRAYETAQIVADGLGGINTFADRRLREIHLGRIEGLNRQEIEAQLGIEFSERLKHTPLSDTDVAMLGSESGEEVARRATEAVIHFFETHASYQSIGVATHGGVLRRLLQYSEAHKLGLQATDQATYPPSIPNGVVFPFTFYPDSKKLIFNGVTIVSP